MRRPPRKSTVDDIPRGADAAPIAAKSPAPEVVVQVWVGMVARMDRRTLNRFTRDIWTRFEDRDLAPLKIAILRRRRVLARQAWP